MKPKKIMRPKRSRKEWKAPHFAENSLFHMGKNDVLSRMSIEEPHLIVSAMMASSC